MSSLLVILTVKLVIMSRKIGNNSAAMDISGERCEIPALVGLSRIFAIQCDNDDTVCLYLLEETV